MLTNAVEKFDSSARRYDRIIKLSKTIADHTGSEKKPRQILPRLYNIDVLTDEIGETKRD